MAETATPDGHRWLTPGCQNIGVRVKSACHRGFPMFSPITVDNIVGKAYKTGFEAGMMSALSD